MDITWEEALKLRDQYLIEEMKEYGFIPIYFINGNAYIDVDKDLKLTKLINTLPITQFYNEEKHIRFYAYQICFPKIIESYEPCICIGDNSDRLGMGKQKQFRDTYPDRYSALRKALEYYLKYQEEYDKERIS